MTDGAERNRELFKTEARELLAGLESDLLELETEPGNAELVGRVFRAMHTLKGSGAMFGFYDIAAFTHEIETVYDMVRNGRVEVTKGLIDLTLSAMDQVGAMLGAIEGQGPADKVISDEIVASFWSLLAGAGAGDGAVAPTGRDTADSRPGVEGGAVTYRIRFRPGPDILKTGTNPLGLLDELRQMGQCRVEAHTEHIPSLEELDPEACYTYWDVTLTTDMGMDAIKDVFIFVFEGAEISVEAVDGPETAPAPASGPGKPGIPDIHKLAEKPSKAKPDGRADGVVSSVRVSSSKLDVLADLVGELVTAQARLNQISASYNDPVLCRIAEEVESLTSELRDNTLSIRMVPIGTMFTKFKRLVRDLSTELGKEVVMTTQGAETELDKTVIERLDDPIVHIIRNSIGHGIELPEARVAAGKQRHGTVGLSAVHSGTHVLVSITDDGAGLDPDKIRAKAVERGLILPDAVLTEKELFGLIFEPGFTTADEVTTVSGRGVGMDVVKRCLDSLRGAVEVSSIKGAGTTITLRLPLTLAIIEGLLVGIGAEQFVLSLSAVDECVEFLGEGMARAAGRRLLDVRGEPLPYICLREMFNITGEPPALEQAVIVKEDGYKVGFVVDRVVGKHQTVIKSLGRFYKDVEGVSGATILGDGTVALILDVSRLIRLAVRREDMETVNQ